jgi:hypothetical protein
MKPSDKVSGGFCFKDHWIKRIIKMSAKRRSDEAEATVTEVNPFEPDMEKATTDFDLEVLLETYKAKITEMDKRKIGISERVSKAKENIARIQSMIEQLTLKASQESGQTWTNQIVRPICGELQKVFPHAAIDISTVLSGAVTVTLCKRGVSAVGKLKNIDCRAVTFVPQENGIGIRDFSSNTGEYPEGSIGSISGLNHPVIAVPADSALQFIVDYLVK